MDNDLRMVEMGDGFGLLKDDEVLFIRGGRVLMANPTFKVIEFLDALAQLVSEQEDGWTEEQDAWFTDRGARCEVLRLTSQGWQRGRVRIRLEFCPDDPPKLLRGSRATREDVYAPPSGEAYRQERPRSGRREDVYRPSNEWRDEPPIYPEIDDY